MEKIKGLVSICVVTYNSGKVIGETLDSIVEQTYQNIELIISDDSSKDDTMLVVKNWLEKNKARFVRTALLETDSNTGVTANCNRACKAARGEFVKLIGDDILLPEYVSEFVAYFREHTETQILFSRVQLLDNDAKTLSDDDKHDYDFFNLTAAEQFKSIIQHHVANQTQVREIKEKLSSYRQRVEMIQADLSDINGRYLALQMVTTARKQFTNDEFTELNALFSGTESCLNPMARQRYWAGVCNMSTPNSIRQQVANIAKKCYNKIK